MSAHLIQKCPGCDRVTSDCIDSTLDKDRTEYQSNRCEQCVKGERKPGHAMNCGTGNSMRKSRKRQAVSTWHMGRNVTHY